MHTHRLTFDGDVVRKQYVSWSKGEADREWAGLVALARHAPGLAPTPVARQVEGGAPVVVMSRVPGAPLGADPLSPVQVEALAAHCGGSSRHRRARRPRSARSAPRRCDGRPGSGRPSCTTWPPARTRRWWVRRSGPGPVLAGRTTTPHHDRVADPVLALGDGNLANVLWDGETCRLVDFEEFGTSDLAYEVADVVEHASSRLGRLLDVDALVAALGLEPAQLARLAAYRRLLATFWLVMLLPGNRGFDRNPAGSTEDQARHVLALLDT